MNYAVIIAVIRISAENAVIILRNSRPRKYENFERKKVNLSTSFEKDYKRPKPEDSIEGGLYGKIEL